jgi:hypothetical protein
MGSASLREHEKYSRSYASAGHGNEPVVPRTQWGKRRTAMDSVRVNDSASAGISQEASSMDNTSYISSTGNARPGTRGKHRREAERRSGEGQ